MAVRPKRVGVAFRRQNVSHSNITFVGPPPNLHAGGVPNEQKCLVCFDACLNPADATPGYRFRQHATVNHNASSNSMLLASGSPAPPPTPPLLNQSTMI